MGTTTPFSVKTQRVTPALAKKWLALNVQTNRRLDKRKVSQYAHLLANKMWDLNGETIKFDMTGNLIDGQHRLAACIEANKGFSTVVVRGLDPATIATIDTGRKRSLADSLKFFGFSHSVDRAGTLQWIYRLQLGPTEGLMIGPTPETLVALDLNEQWGEHLTIALGEIPRLRSITRKWSNLARALYVMTMNEAPQEVLESWTQKLIHGTPMRKDDPVAALRTYLFEWSLRSGDKDARKGGHWSNRRPAIYLVKSWNDHCVGGERKVLKIQQREHWTAPKYLHPSLASVWSNLPLVRGRK